MTTDNKISPGFIRDEGSAAYLRPICLSLAAAIYALIFTGGAIWLTGPISFFVLFSTLWIAMIMLSEKKFKGAGDIVVLVLSIPAGLLFAFVRSSVTDRPAKILLLGGGLAVIALLALWTGMYKTHKGFLTALLIAGVWMRLSFIVVIPFFAMCNDVGDFTDRYNILHSGYIQFVNFTGRLINLDVREFGEWYHPPYYHYSASAVLDLQKLIFPSRAENWEGMRALTFLSSVLTLYFSYAITGFLKMTKAGRKAAVAVLAFLPALIMEAGNLNNDSMGLMFTMASILFILDWKKTGRYTTLVIAALSMGLSVGTKLSGALAAPAVLVVIIAGMIKSFKEKSYARAIISPVLYGLISLPLGLWYFIRNYIMFGVPLTYILRPTSDYMYLGDIPFWARLIPDEIVGAEDCFFRNGLEGDPDHSIPIALCKTGLFNEAIMRDQMGTALTGYILFWLFAFLMLLGIAGLIYFVYFSYKNDRCIARLALGITVFVNLVLYLRMNIEFPFACTMNMRYILPAVITGSVAIGDLYGLFAAKIPLAKTILKMLIAVFMLMVVAFYMACALYFD